MIYHRRCSVRGSSNAGESITLTLQRASKSFCILISRHLGFVAWLDLSCPVIIEAHWAWDHLCRCHQDAAYLIPCSNREGQGGRVGSDSSSRYGREIFRSRSGITGSNHFLSRITRHIAVSQRMIQMNGLFAIVVVLCSRPFLVLPKRPTGTPARPAGPTYTKLKGHTLCMIMVHESEKMMPLWTWMGARIDPSLPTCLPDCVTFVSAFGCRLNWISDMTHYLQRRNERNERVV